jgi:hypothetical protein
VAGQGESLPSFSPRLPGTAPEQPDIPALSARLNTTTTETALLMEETSLTAWIRSVYHYTLTHSAPLFPGRKAYFH